MIEILGVLGRQNVIKLGNVIRLVESAKDHHFSEETFAVANIVEDVSDFFYCKVLVRRFVEGAYNFSVAAITKFVEDLEVRVEVTELFKQGLFHLARGLARRL